MHWFTASAQSVQAWTQSPPDVVEPLPPEPLVPSGPAVVPIRVPSGHCSSALSGQPSSSEPSGHCWSPLHLA